MYSSDRRVTGKYGANVRREHPNLTVGGNPAAIAAIVSTAITILTRVRRAACRAILLCIASSLGFISDSEHTATKTLLRLRLNSGSSESSLRDCSIEKYFMVFLLSRSYQGTTFAPLINLSKRYLHNSTLSQKVNINSYFQKL